MRALGSLVFFLFLLVNVQVVFGQTEVVKSTEIVQDINGVNYYLHKVSQGETLYGISKAYSVSVDEIVHLNKDAEAGLKVGQELKIPIIDAKVQHNEPVPEAPDGFVYHKVTKGETLYRIMYNYQITFEDLKKHNPDLTENLQLGQLILIPTADQRKAELAAQKYDSLVFYTLKARDNYYRLEKKFGLSQQQLEQLNPELKSKGMQKGMAIKVPFQGTTTDMPQYEPIELDSVHVDQKQIRLYEPVVITCDPIIFNQNTYKVGFLIPIFSNLDSEIRVESDYLIKQLEDYKSFRFIEFYQGALLALDSLEKLGFKAEVYVWDTQADVKKVDSICALPAFQDLDLVIGPFYSKNIPIVRKAASQHSIKMVDMFSNTIQSADTNATHFISKITDQDAYNALTEYISDSISNYRISIIHYGKADELKRLQILKKSFWRTDLKIDTSRVFVYDYRQDGMTDLIAEMEENTVNIMFNLVNSEARVSNFLRQVNLEREKKRVMVMALDKYWSRYKTLEIGYLSDLEYTCATDYHIDMSDPLLVIPFENKFYTAYKRIPGRMAYLGYDYTWYFGNALYNYGSQFPSCFDRIHVQTMHNSFKYAQALPGFYRNKKCRVVKYDNYQKLVKTPVH